MRDSTDDFERRKCHALRRLNSDNPKCFACGLNDWRCLEAHHLAGKAHDAATVVVCRNDHRILSDSALDHPATPPGLDPALAAIAYFLLGLADALVIVMERLRAFAADLMDRAAAEAPAQTPSSV